MSAITDLKKQNKSKVLTDVLHIFVLSGFAFAPLYNLLSQYADFFVARDAKPVEILLVAVIFSFAIPAVLSTFELIAGIVSSQLRRIIHFIISLLIIITIFMQIFKKFESLSYITIFSLAVVSGLILTALYFRLKKIQDFLTMLSPSILIFPMIFLFFSPVKKIILPKNISSSLSDSVKVESDIPIIFIIFDEFPLVSLMDEKHEIDPVRYPNFRKLADESYWFRNFTTNSRSTAVAIPIALTGKYPEKYKLMTAEEYPESLFTILGNSYSIKAYESSGHMCPEVLNDLEIEQGLLSQRMFSTLLDLSIVYLHISLPISLADKLPPIDMNWGGFVEPPSNKDVDSWEMSWDMFLAKTAENRLTEFNRFIESIEQSEKPSFHFIHTLLPHSPWEYFPSGQLYNGRPLPMKPKKNEWLVLQAYQRHLLQVGAVDTLVGDLVTHLKKIGMYDKSLIILTADHGLAFQPNLFGRVSQLYESDIMPVPLLIKIPNQNEGVISDDNVESIDLLPTIADVLDVKIPWKVDGVSMFDDSVSSRPNKTMFLPQRQESKNEKLLYDPINEEKYKSLNYKLSKFGSGTTKPNGYYNFDSFSGLIGEKINDIEMEEASNIDIKMKKIVFISDSDFNEKTIRLPCYISGTIENIIDQPLDDKISLAVSVNNVIQTTTRTYMLPNSDTTNFYSIIPEDSLKAGRNEIEVFIISSTEEGDIHLLKVIEFPYTYKDDSTLVSENGEVSIIPEAVNGRIEKVEKRIDSIYLEGWAVDVKNSKLIDDIIVVINNEVAFMAKTDSERPDISGNYKNEKLEMSGFNFFFPSYLLDKNSDIQIFAVSNRVASEIPYKRKYLRKFSDLPKKVTKDKKEKSDQRYNRIVWGLKGFFKMSYINDGKVITSYKGNKHTVTPDKVLRGWVDSIEVKDRHIEISGWSADVKNSRLVDKVIVFVDGKSVTWTNTFLSRRSVSRVLNNDKLEMVGFKLSLPANKVKSGSDVRVIAVLGDIATELSYNIKVISFLEELSKLE